MRPCTNVGTGGHRDLVPGGQVVENDDVVPLVEEPGRNDASDESGTDR